MKILDNTLNFQIPGESAVTLGKFDGIHKGHQKLMDKILEKKAQGLRSVVFTFGQMPGSVFLGTKGQMILTGRERQERLEKMGIDYMIECPFVKQIIRMEPEKFIEEILVRQLHVRYLAVGPDFHYGYQRKGDCSLLQRVSEKYGFRTEVVEKECLGDQTISSTYVREMLEQGRMDIVKELLGYPYYVSGEVIHGNRIGRTLGIPTMNILPEEEKILPPNGVYLTKTKVGSVSYPGITNIGVKPTVSGEEKKGIETHLFDYEGDLYGKELKVEFYAFERAEQKFESLEALKKQLEKDVQWGRNFMENTQVI